MDAKYVIERLFRNMPDKEFTTAELAQKTGARRSYVAKVILQLRKSYGEQLVVRKEGNDVYYKFSPHRREG
jgi:hypothetical protein